MTMPLLTETAIEDWEERLARRIRRRIEAIAAGDPGLLARVARQARRSAWQSLGLAEMKTELEAVAAQQEVLKRRQRQAHRAMLATLRRVPIEAVADAPSGRPPPEVRR